MTILSQAAALGFRIVVDKKLRPRLERERSRDGSCVNLSAVGRNEKATADASKVYILKRERLMVCAPHVFEALFPPIVQNAVDKTHRVTKEKEP